MTERLLLMGDEAVALGAYHAGALFASAYPGTPSTEIIEHFSTLGDVYAEWAPNEKVALEAAAGACLGGVRAFASMKHVGLNVAADPFFTLPYTGVNAGLVIVSADDPEMHSSQNEQDNRYYALAAGVPMLEPADSQEAYDFTRLAFEISERFDTPVLLRITTRLCHSRTVVEPREPLERKVFRYEKDERKRVMIPGHARLRHPVVLERLKRLEEYSNDFLLRCLDPYLRDKWEKGGASKDPLVFVSSGVAFQYVKEAFPEAPVLKISLTFPLPREVVTKVCSGFERVLVVEELEPYLENALTCFGLEPVGKQRVPRTGELNVERVREAFPEVEGLDIEKRSLPFDPDSLPARPPILCSGCPHRGIMYALSRLGAIISGDIGCYTLSVLPPLSAHDCQVCMGASITMAHGLSKAFEIGRELAGGAGVGEGTSQAREGGDTAPAAEDFEEVSARKGKAKRKVSNPVVAVIGDSTFFHSGVTGLMEMAYNRGSFTVVILDNRTTAMTGFQEHPGTGVTLGGEETHSVDIEMLARALGIENVRMVDPYDLDECTEVLFEEMNRDAPSLVISRRACALRDMEKRKRYEVVNDECNGCMLCMRLGCPAIVRRGDDIVIVEDCRGCTLCVQVCRKNAIKPVEGGA